MPYYKHGFNIRNHGQSELGRLQHYEVRGFSEALFKELRSFNIKVTCLNPGSNDSRFFESPGIEANRNMLQHEDIVETLVHIRETPDNMLINELTVPPLNRERA